MKPLAGSTPRPYAGWIHGAPKGFRLRRPAGPALPREPRGVRIDLPLPAPAPAPDLPPPAASEFELPVSAELLVRLREAGL